MIGYSIIIPYYNHLEFFDDLMRGLENQSGFIFEVIFIDDGSTQGPILQKIREYTGNLKHKIKYFHQQNSGTYQAINRGIELASSSHVAILNSDDYFGEKKLHRCTEILNQNNCDFVFGKVSFIDGKGKSIDHREDCSWYEKGLTELQNYKTLPSLLIHENISATSSNFVFSRELVEKIGGFKNYKYANDLDFILRACFEGRVFFDISETHVYYRYHNSNSIKESEDETTKEVSRIASQHYHYFQAKGIEVEFWRAVKSRGLKIA